jgi:membrane protein required for colicin V production
VTAADVAIVTIIVISALLGLLRGFVKEAVALVTWVAAIWLAMVFSGTVAAWLPTALERATFSLGGTDFEIRNLRLGLAFILLIVGTLIAGAIINHLLSRITKAQVLKSTDRALGAVFGVARGAAIVVILVLAAGLTLAPQTDWWQASRLMPPFERGAQRVLDLLPPAIAEHFSFGRAV